MSREVHVRFWERGGVRFPSATHLVILVSGTREQAEAEKAALGDYLRQKHGSGAVGGEDPDLGSDRGL